MHKHPVLWLLLGYLAASPATALERLGDPSLVQRSARHELPAIAADFLSSSARWSDADSRQALLTSVSQWLTANYGFASTQDLPRIVQAAPAQISARRYGPLSSGASQETLSATNEGQLSTVAIYLDKERTIYLPEDFTGSTPAELSVLVHEMVHHLQTLEGLHYECPQAREKPAYLAQERWLRQFERDLWSEFQIDPFTLLLRSGCIH